MGNITDWRIVGVPLLALVLAVMALLTHPRLASCGNDTTTRMVALINAARADAFSPAVRCDERLLAAADFHTTWMVDHKCLSHHCPDEQSMWDRIQTRGYPTLYAVGEIAAFGQRSADEVVDAWLNSPGHHDIMLSEKYPDVGCAEKGGYWTCDFALGNPPLAYWFLPLVGEVDGR